MTMKQKMHIVYVCTLTILSLFSWNSAGEKMESTAGLPMHAPNFRLLDTQGESHELAAHKDAKVVVLFVQMNGCPIVRQSYPYLEEISAEYGPKGVVFLYVNSNPWDTNESIIEECKEYSATPPVLRDNTRALAHALGFTRSAEVFVIDPRSNDILYRGMADDRFDYGLQRMSPSKFWLRDTLEAVVTKEESVPEPTIVKGCVIDMEYYERPDFSKEVAPVLAAKLPTQYGAEPSEAAVRTNPQPLLAALLTGRVFGRDVALSPEEGEALAAWYFSPSSAQSSAH